MSLAIVVGLLTEVRQRDKEGAVQIEEDLNKVSRYLDALGLPGHREPEEVEYFDDSFGYGAIHHLRRDAVCLEEIGRLPTPLPPDANAGDDARVGRWYERAQTKMVAETSDGASVGVVRHRESLIKRLLGHRRGRFDHLLAHSDADDYYFPIEFDDVVAVMEPGAKQVRMFGSSQRLLVECESLRRALCIPDSVKWDGELGLRLDEASTRGAADWEHHPSAGICITLIEAARRSIASGGAIFFA